jgi:hypothetical protein
MAIIEVITPYELLARWTTEGLQGCQVIERKQFIEDTTGQVLGESLGAAVHVTKQHAVQLLRNATPIPLPTVDDA